MDSEIASKLLCATSRKLDTASPSIEQYQDLDPPTLDVVIRSLKIHESKVKIELLKEKKRLS